MWTHGETELGSPRNVRLPRIAGGTGPQRPMRGVRQTADICAVFVALPAHHAAAAGVASIGTGLATHEPGGEIP